MQLWHQVAEGGTKAISVNPTKVQADSIILPEMGPNMTKVHDNFYLDRGLNSFGVPGDATRRSGTWEGTNRCFHFKGHQKPSRPCSRTAKMQLPMGVGLIQMTVVFSTSGAVLQLHAPLKASKK